MAKIDVGEKQTETSRTKTDYLQFGFENDVGSDIDTTALFQRQQFSYGVDVLN